MNSENSIWIQLLLGGLALLSVFIFWPGIQVAMEKSRDAVNKDWLGALIPVVAVILFVIVLILML